MATIRCPQGCRWISKIGNTTFERRDVSIFADVCDHSDRCDIENCEYFDNSKQATKRFIKALTLSHGTGQQRQQAMHYEQMLRLKHEQKSPN